MVGSNIAGIILAVGDSIVSDAAKLGTRVAAYVPYFFMRGKPDYDVSGHGARSRRECSAAALESDFQ